jgi:hypothetical protein
MWSLFYGFVVKERWNSWKNFFNKLDFSCDKLVGAIYLPSSLLSPLFSLPFPFSEVVRVGASPLLSALSPLLDCCVAAMGLSRRWSVESKDFEMLVKDDSTELVIKERCRGQLRSIRLNSQESMWLLKFFDQLVVAEDSTVYWDWSKSGFPRVLAQSCFNRH